MFNTKKISIIALILLVIGMAGSLLTVKAAHQNTNYQDEKVFTNKDIINLDIEADQAEIQIIPVSEPTTKVEVTGKVGNSKEITFDARVEGNTLKVELKEKRYKLFNFDFFESGMKLFVYVPEKEYDRLDTKVVNGRINAKNLKVNQSTLSSVNGEIDVVGVHANDISVNADNGKIKLENVSGNITGKTINGEILLKTDGLDQNMSLESVNGKVEIQTVMEPTNVIIDAEVVNGRVKIFDETKRSFIAGNGDYHINLSVVNGEIKVSKGVK